MAYLDIENVKITGIATAVPKKTQYTRENKDISKDYDPEEFIKSTGIESSRLDDNLTSLDLCKAAGDKILNDLGWDRKEVELLILVTQCPDYIAPSSACILQDKLGLSKDCYSIEISLGCSGWVYGLSTAASLMSNGNIKKGLLLAGDGRFLEPIHDPLVGFAGTATALEYSEGNDGFKFQLGTDGSGYDAIIIPNGATRNRFTEGTLVPPLEGDKSRLLPWMQGMDVFSFAITTVPKSIKNLCKHFDIHIEDVDYCILHQANLQIDEIIRKKLKFEESQVPYSLRQFGNTSSASIPITFSTMLKHAIENKNKKYICSGFGVGLSWGSVYFQSNGFYLSDLVEL